VAFVLPQALFSLFSRYYPRQNPYAPNPLLALSHLNFFFWMMGQLLIFSSPNPLSMFCCSSILSLLFSPPQIYLGLPGDSLSSISIRTSFSVPQKSRSSPIGWIRVAFVVSLESFDPLSPPNGSLAAVVRSDRKSALSSLFIIGDLIVPFPFFFARAVPPNGLGEFVELPPQPLLW